MGSIKQAVSQTEETVVDLESLRQARIAAEREFYLADEGFLDFARDSGASPDAVFQPHGRYCQDLITWRGEPDPDNPEITIYKWKVALWPRGSFKSAVFNAAHVAWMIAKDPNIRILVCSETGKQARKFVKLAMGVIDSEWYRERFGVHRGKEDWKLASGEFKSALCSKEFRHRKEPTLLATGVGEVQTGAHWDVVIMDDVCSQENTKTADAIEALWFWFGETLAQLDPGCKLFVIGTLHHYADIYCRIKKDPDMRALFEMSVHSWRNEKGELFFPTRLTTRFVLNQKTLMPPRLWACFYENRPTTGEQQLFLPEYFRVIKDDDVPQSIWSYILTDFAFLAQEKKDKADRTALWVVALDANRTAYVLDFYVGRWKPSDSVRIVCDLWGRYQWANLKGVSLEQTTYDELLQSVFEEVRRQTFVKPKMIGIRGRSQEIKDMRIEASEPRWRRGDIYFVQSLRSNMRKWKPLLDEMTEWPFSAHDDIPDAQSDLDKRDTNNKLYMPGPPAGWRCEAIHQVRPTMINGQYNPDYGYDPREFTKANQGNHDIWKSTPQQPRQEDAQRQDSGSIWTRQPQAPTRLDKS